MSTAAANSLSLNACISCKQSKRKCDRTRPTCSTCDRVGRNCFYEEDTHPIYQQSENHHGHSIQSRSDDGGTTQSYQSPSAGQSPQISFSFPGTTIDPFRHETLRRPTVDIAINTEATKIFRSLEEIQHVADKYFDTIYQRFPIISKARFLDRLPFVFSKPAADFTVLCLCIHLVLQSPSQDDQSMQSSLYVTVKNSISLLESTSFLSLEVVQARLLVTFYEIGHGIHPGGSISIATAARTARLLGLNKKHFQQPSTDSAARVIAEEEKRVWWGVVNLDRFINICNGDSLFTTEDPKSTDHLPIDDVMWARNVIPDTESLTFSTPSNVLVGQLARECQISHLVGRVLRHVFDPVSDPEFHAREALQLERTLMAFVPLLIEEHTKYGMYCAAYGMCCCALFILYDSALLHTPPDAGPQYKIGINNSLDVTSTRIAEFSAHIFGDPEAADKSTFSPFVPYSLYLAAIVQYRFWKQTSEERHKKAFDSLKMVLGFENRRWLVGGKYLNALENLEGDFPSTLLPLHGSYINDTGPSG